VPVSKDLTELVDIDPTRVDLVKNPANGFPILLMKALAEPAEPVDTPDTSGTDLEKDAEVPDTQTPPAPEAPEVSKTEPEAVEKSAAELAEEAVAKAVQPLQEVIKGLEAEMAVLKSTPIPGGPVVTVPTSQRTAADKANHLAEAQRFDRLAKSISGNAELTAYYENKAAEARKAANG
jgi:hypothetical protein